MLPERDRCGIQELSSSNLTFHFHGEIDAIDDAETKCTDLQTLKIQDCVFDFGREGVPVQGTITTIGTAQCDPLHHLLRQSLNLEDLNIHCGLYFGDGGSSLSSYNRELIQLDDLHTLRMSPPHMWTVDIAAPRLLHLAFDLTEVFRDPYLRLVELASCGRGLVPPLEAFRYT